VGLEFALIATIPLIFSPDVTSYVVSDIFLGFYTILAISYGVIIMILRRTLKKLDDYGNFRTEQTTVIRQFGFFAIAFTLKLAVQVIYIIGGNFYDWTSFTYVMIEVMSYFFVDFMPVAFMVHCHH